MRLYKTAGELTAVYRGQQTAVTSSHAAGLKKAKKKKYSNLYVFCIIVIIMTSTGKSVRGTAISLVYIIGNKAQITLLHSVMRVITL